MHLAHHLHSVREARPGWPDLPFHREVEILRVYPLSLMQTFLPYADFIRSAKCLDYRRLGKQRVECKQIYLALTTPSYGWQSHPAVIMWRGSNDSLALYGLTMCLEWRMRGYSDSLMPFFRDRVTSLAIPPAWLGIDAVHESHQSNLLRKDPVFYGQFNWPVPPTLPYIWPSLADRCT